jgi:hypothetical protein
MPLEFVPPPFLKSLRSRSGGFRIARNFAINLFPDNMFENMAQAQRLCSFGLDTLQQLFRMK